tara:strand:+ start:1014 stop:1595 length:582 start_codon:yes stop_codon:yes gene_type:complete
MLEILNSIDTSLMFYLNKSLSNTFFDKIMPFITEKDNWIIPFILLFIYLAFFSGKRGQICLVILIISISLTDSISTYILKPYFQRVRPSHDLYDLINLLVSKGGRLSMPSNHASNIFSATVVVSYFYNKIKIPMYIIAFIIAFSRIYVGVHYPGDIIIGSLFGYAVGWFTLTLWVILKMRELKRRKTWVWYKN